MNSKDNSKYWIAVYTRPRHEKKVCNILQETGFEVYLPTLKEKRKWSDRKKWVSYPLFRSYIFVKTESKNVLFIIKTYGVVKIIKFGKEVAVIQDSVIEAIKVMLNGEYSPEPLDYFLKGDPVIVKDGPLKGLIGEVIRIDNDDRLVVRIDAIKHSISVRIDRKYLKPFNH